MGDMVQPKEPWHLHYYTGDQIPQAVLAYEHSSIPPEDDDMIQLVNLTDPKAEAGSVQAGTHTYAVSGVVARHMERDEDITELIHRFGAVDNRGKGTTSSRMFVCDGPLKTA